MIRAITTIMILLLPGFVNASPYSGGRCAYEVSIKTIGNRQVHPMNKSLEYINTTFEILSVSNPNTHNCHEQAGDILTRDVVVKPSSLIEVNSTETIKKHITKGFKDRLRVEIEYIHSPKDSNETTI